MTAPSLILHAGLIAARVGGLWRGALILGPSGVGKSDLALRATGAGFRLVADDRTRLFVSAGRLFGRAPEPLRGLIEIRGVGVVREEPLFVAAVAVAVRCKNRPEAVERFPEPAAERWLGVTTPVIELWPLEDSAPAKIGRAIESLGWRP